MKELKSSFLLEKYQKKKGMMKMYYAKPNLKNLSQGARLEYIRRFRHMDQDNISNKLGLTG